MAASFVTYPGDGSQIDFSVTFPYLDKQDVIVTVNDIPVSFTFLNDSTVRVSPAPAGGTAVRVRRITQKTSGEVNFTDGSTLLERDLDTSNTRATYIGEEATDAVGLAMVVDSFGNFAARSTRVVSLAPGVTPTDAVNKAQLDAVTGAVQASSDSAARSAQSASSDAATAAAAVIGVYPGIYRVGILAALADDCGPYIQAAVNSFGGNPGVVVIDPAYVYTQKTSVLVPFNVSIAFNDALIVPADGGAFIGGFMYLLNMDASQNQVVLQSTNFISHHPFIHNFRANTDTSGYTAARAFLTKSRHQFDGLWCRGMSQAVRKVGGNNDQYTDRLKFKNFEIQSAVGTDFMLDVQYYGDALEIESYHHPAGATSNQNAIHVKNCNGGSIRHLINGSVKLEQCSAFTMENVHNEYGSIELMSTSASLRDIFQWYRPDLGQVPLTISVSDGGGRYPMSVEIENYRHVMQHNLSTPPLAGNYTDADFFDAKLTKGVSINHRNWKRFYFVNLDPSLGYETAPRLTYDGVTSISQWDVNPSVACKSGSITGSGLVRSAITSLPIPGSTITDYGVSSTSHDTWTEAPGTYYYAAQILWGPRDRRVGQNATAERSVTIADAAHVPSWTFEPASADVTGCCTLRLYRGTSPGVYDKVVEMPVGNTPKVYDKGHYLASGERWRTRTAGAVDAINTGYSRIDVMGNNVTVYGSAAPTVGTWTRGDVVIKLAPQWFDVPRYECTGGGTPGTWASDSKPSKIFSASFDPPTMAAGGTSVMTVAASGVVTGDFAVASFDLNGAGPYVLRATCMTDAVEVEFANVTGGTFDVSAGTVRVRVWKL